MKEQPFEKFPQFNEIGEFDTSFDYGIANALSTSGHTRPWNTIDLLYALGG